MTQLVSWLCWTSGVNPGSLSPRPAGVRLWGLQPSVWGPGHGPSQPELGAMTRDGAASPRTARGVFGCSREEGSSPDLEVGWLGPLALNMGLIPTEDPDAGRAPRSSWAGVACLPGVLRDASRVLVEGKMGARWECPGSHARPAPPLLTARQA